MAYAVSNAYGRVSYSLFDIRDRTTNSVNANNITNVVSYDILGRVLVRTVPADGSTESFGYNVYGMIAYTNQLGKVTLYDYDIARRNIAITNANGEITRFAYDPSGLRTNLLDGKGQSTAWGYNQYGLLTNKLDAKGTNLFSYDYDANDHLTSRWSAAKGTTRYYYDVVGNLTNTVYPSSPSITLSYDPLNRVTNITDAVGTTSYQFTSFGSSLSEDGPWDSDTISYSYKTNHLIESVTVQMPNGSPWKQSYDYDHANRLEMITAPEGIHLRLPGRRRPGSTIGVAQFQLYYKHL